MNRRTARVLALVAAALAAPAAGHSLRRLPTETRIVVPLADPRLAPGVSSCTSDGACTVTDERGTRRGTSLATRPRRAD